MTILDYLHASPAFFITAVALFGATVGSFLNVVIHRLPIMMERQWRQQCAEFSDTTETTQPTETFNLAKPDSRCPHCGHKIRAWENIPIISYLFLKGRCSGCDAGISIRYPIIEAVTAVLSALAAWQFGLSWETASALLLTWSLVSLTMIDIDHQLLPDSITLPFLWIGLGLNLFGVYTDLSSAVIGAMAGYLSLWSIYWGFKLLTGKEGMGYGDFKLLAMLGAWMGWQALPVIILLSSLVGAAIGIAMVVIRGRDHNIPIPFGPYLAIAGLIGFYWGNDLTNAYMRISGLS